jgi:bacitracin transport system ATP-binding protein
VIEYLTEQEVLNMDSNYIIETKNLTKQYGSQKSVADLNIHVKRGRIYGLLGRNGAGKTTTMKMLLGLTKPTSGEVKIWGKSLQGNEKKLLPRIGSLIESPGFYPNLTGTENLRIFATLRGVPNNHAIKDAPAAPLTPRPTVFHSPASIRRFPPGTRHRYVRVWQPD